MAIEGRSAIISDISDISDAALQQLRADIRSFLELNPPAIPLAQMLGFSRLVYQLATSLPTSPADGQWIALKLGTNFIWQFRYFKDFTDQYKWVFVGGVPQQAIVDGASSTSSNTYISLGGPSLTVPVSGIYNITMDVAIEVPAVGGDEDQAWASPSIGGATPSDLDAVFLKMVNPNASTITTRLFETRTLVKTLSANQVVEVKYRTNAASATFVNRRLLLTPIRVG